MTGYSHVIFDLDGTLLNTTEGLLDSVRFSLAEIGLPPMGKRQLESLIGPPIGASIQKIFSLSDSQKEQFVEIFRNRYKNHDLLKAFAYDDIYDLIVALKKNHIVMAVATFKRYDYARLICEHFKFTEYMDVIEGSDFASDLTKQDILENSIRHLNAEKASCVMIGDTESDAAAAHQAGVDFIAVMYGYGFKDQNGIGDIPHVFAAGSAKDILSFLSNVK